MRIWPVVFRALGGGGPEDTQQYRVARWYDVATWLAVALKTTGFLKRDPDSQNPSWYINFRWQWRFWRGPYRDCLERERRI